MAKPGRPRGDPKILTSVGLDVETWERVRKADLTIRTLIVRGFEWESLKDQIRDQELVIQKLERVRETMQQTIIDQGEIIDNNERAKKADPMDGG